MWGGCFAPQCSACHSLCCDCSSRPTSRVRFLAPQALGVPSLGISRGSGSIRAVLPQELGGRRSLWATPTFAPRCPHSKSFSAMFCFFAIPASFFGKEEGEASSSGLCCAKKPVWMCEDTQAGVRGGSALFPMEPSQTWRCFSRSRGPAGVPVFLGCQSLWRAGSDHRPWLGMQKGARSEGVKIFMEPQQSCKLCWAVAEPLS